MGLAGYLIFHSPSKIATAANRFKLKNVVENLKKGEHRERNDVSSLACSFVFFDMLSTSNKSCRSF